MKCWQWSVLIFELALFAVILVLPQVDLPDFTFHGATAPVAAKARISARPVQAVTVSFCAMRLRKTREKPADTISPAPKTDSGSRFSVLCTLLC